MVHDDRADWRTRALDHYGSHGGSGLDLTMPAPEYEKDGASFNVLPQAMTDQRYRATLSQ